MLLKERVHSNSRMLTVFYTMFISHSVYISNYIEFFSVIDVSYMWREMIALNSLCYFACFLQVFAQQQNNTPCTGDFLPSTVHEETVSAQSECKTAHKRKVT